MNKPMPISSKEAKDILKHTPGQEFALMAIRVPILNEAGYIIAGYHIFLYDMPRAIIVKGDKIWDYVFY